MKLFGVLMAALLVVGMAAGTARAEEEKVVQEKMVVRCGEDGECKVMCGEDEEGGTCIIKVNKDGEEQVIKMKAGGGLIELDAEGEVMTLDCHELLEAEGDGVKKVIRLKSPHGMYSDIEPETRIKLLDEKIRYLKATSKHELELNVAKCELEKLKLAEKDAEVTAVKKRIVDIKAELEKKELEYEQAVQELLPEGMDEMFLFGLDLEEMLEDIDIDIDVSEDGEHKTMKVIKVKVDEEED